MSARALPLTAPDEAEIEQVLESSPLLGKVGQKPVKMSPALMNVLWYREASHVKKDIAGVVAVASKPVLVAIALVVAIILACFLYARTSVHPILGFYGQYGADRWVLSLLPNRTNGFFMDIGAYDGEWFSNTKLLEQHGWRGMCADPFPRNFNSRSCKVVAEPIGATSGNPVKMADCSDGITGFLHPDKQMLSGIKEDQHVFGKKVANCPEVNMSTVGIVDLLALGNAPSIIDYVNLDTEGSEMEILRQFPFDKHCVRTWTVEHNCEEPKQTQIKELLKSHGCRVEQVMVDFWAVCPCGEDLQHITSAAFEFAFKSPAFFPTSYPWTGALAKCLRGDNLEATHKRLSTEGAIVITKKHRGPPL